MSLRLDGDVIHLEGVCRVEDAEALVRLLESSQSVKLDVSGCQGMHAAIAQTILAYRRPIIGQPTEGFLGDHLVPALARAVKAAL